MHIDSFFEYLLDKSHPYYTDPPPLNDPHPASGRDGVTAEDDLALRALDPSFKPKRGRKRQWTMEMDCRVLKGSAHIAPSSYDERLLPTYAKTAYPYSATDLGNRPGPREPDPWTTISPREPPPLQSNHLIPQSAILPGPRTLHWQTQQTPATPHPFSAIEKIGHAFDEPMSAVTLSSKRKRHGPAVSSAWSNSKSSGAKPRGRPPAQRSATDGPYITFPVKPASETSTSMQPTTPLVDGPGVLSGQSSISLLPHNRERERERLRLQVPQHTGAPVRLMTPPRLEQAIPLTRQSSSQYSSDVQTTSGAKPQATSPYPPVISSCRRDDPAELLKRALAADLLRAELTGREGRLTGHEATALSSAAFKRITPMLTTAEANSALSTATSWLCLRNPLDPEAVSASARRPRIPKKINITRFIIDEEGYEVPISTANATTSSAEVTVSRQVFDIIWSDSIGGLRADFSIRDLEIGPSSSPDIIDDTVEQTGADRYRVLEHRSSDIMAAAGIGRQHGATIEDGEEAGVDWRARYMALEENMKTMMGLFERAREAVLDTALSL